MERRKRKEENEGVKVRERDIGKGKEGTEKREKE